MGLRLVRPSGLLWIGQQEVGSVVQVVSDDPHTQFITQS